MSSIAHIGRGKPVRKLVLVYSAPEDRSLSHRSRVLRASTSNARPPLRVLALRAPSSHARLLDRIRRPLVFTPLAISVLVLGFWLLDVALAWVEPTSPQALAVHVRQHRLPSMEPAGLELVVTAGARDRR
jgi:hypothetical protein